MTEFVSNREETTDDRICEHLWLKKAGSDHRANPAEICVKCDTVRSIHNHITHRWVLTIRGYEFRECKFCSECGEKL